jgi:hypothetical protein
MRKDFVVFFFSGMHPGRTSSLTVNWETMECSGQEYRGTIKKVCPHYYTCCCRIIYSDNLGREGEFEMLEGGNRYKWIPDCSNYEEDESYEPEEDYQDYTGD